MEKIKAGILNNTFPEFMKGLRGKVEAMPPHKFTVASKYIDGIRHRDKKNYAREYYRWLRHPCHGTVHEIEAPPYPNMTSMGAQAVRMRLDEIMGV